MVTGTTASASSARAALVALVGLALAGCTVHYSGAGRATTRAALAEQPGWTFTDVPELKQRELADCGPTALAILAAHWGIAPEATMDAIEHKRDSTFAELREAARALGLEAYVIAGDADTLVHELSLDRPVIVGLLRPYGRRYAQGHYEVIAGVNPARRLAATVDPGGGWRVRSFEELDAEWLPTKRAAMVVIGASARTAERQRTESAPRGEAGATDSAN